MKECVECKKLIKRGNWGHHAVTSAHRKNVTIQLLKDKLEENMIH